LLKNKKGFLFEINSSIFRYQNKKLNKMETTSTCPKFAKCPIYQKDVFINEKAGTTYKNLFCTAGELKYKSCKRFIISEKMGRPAPDNIMPNSSMSIDDIISKM